MNMSEEEKEYIIENIDELIRLAKKVGTASIIGTDDVYIQSIIALDKQRLKVLSMDGIEGDY
ncbi:hypothetical protein [Klebsiella phage PhiKpNIH-6]|uniref:Uncharacterized protein n=1 Tax=Klebsiella phage PhiKpNIH-6 TaxID=2689112 RepID=A0A6B9LS08_9CAUD|nr:hypothetical protein [Klebsiella phage PhiKpNIH-6]